MPDVRIITSDALDGLKQLPDESVHAVITSPPYWSQRCYDTGVWVGGSPACDHRVPTKHQTPGGSSCRAGRSNLESQRTETFAKVCGKCGAVREDKQIGLEDTLAEYIAKMVAVFREVRRVLRKDGLCWIVIGDTYAQPLKGSTNDFTRADYSEVQKHHTGSVLAAQTPDILPARKPECGFKPKDLCMVPERLALALQADGWWIRARCPWVKPQSMPDSTEDRPSSPVSVEYIWLMAKNPRYYYDNEGVKVKAVCDRQRGPATWKRKPGGGDNAGLSRRGMDPLRARRMNDWFMETFRGLYQVADDEPLAFIVNPQGSKVSHFATYPVSLVVPMLVASTSERGCCPVCGVPWSRVVARSQHGDEPARGQQQWAAATGQRDNQGGYPEVGSLTLGWRPDCAHYDLPLISDPPREPARKLEEPDSSFATRHAAWQQEMVAWQAEWDRLKPQYDDLPVEPCTVLDPFSGAGTTGMAAKIHGRHYIGIELSEKYAEWSKKRIASAKADGSCAAIKEEQDLPLLNGTEAQEPQA